VTYHAPVDLADSPANAAIRRACRAWLKEHLPWTYGEGLPPRFESLEDEVAFGRSWQARVAEGRWVGVAWPQEYGGRGAGPAASFVVQEELARARAPELVGRIGVNLVGPTLLAYGTTEQKTRWLPDILSARRLWCQLFSEPDAGSDLASLRTTAVRDDSAGGWRLEGQKVWTSYAQFADLGLCLARTDLDAPKRKGISAMVVDMHAPGVEVRPLVQATGEAEFNEVFLDGVLVPDDALVGPEHEGWRVSQSTLGHERGVNPRQLVIHLQHLEELLSLADASGAFEVHRLRQRLAEAWVEVKLFQLHNLRSLTRAERGEQPGPEGSALKLYWSEMSQRLHATAMEVLGDEAVLWRGAVGLAGDGEWQRSWLYYLSASIFAGTNEIQRTIISERVLGLPREPSPAGTGGAR
jgi:alkylation response protein AidB-like acyl-CoA dehydrogenase